MAATERTISIAAIAGTPIPARGYPLWVDGSLPSEVSATGLILLVPGPTGPGLAALLMVAAGIVCASPTATGHAVILARELGIACMIGVRDVELMRDAAIVELKPDAGVVRATWI